MFDASNAQTASRWKPDALLGQPRNIGAPADGFQTADRIASGEGFVSSALLSRTKPASVAKSAQVPEAGTVARAPAQDDKHAQGGSSGQFQSDPLLHRRPETGSTEGQEQDGASPTSMLDAATTDAGSPEASSTMASAAEAQDTADETLADATSAAEHQPPTASDDTSADKSAEKSADASADASAEASADVSADMQQLAVAADIDEQIETLPADALEASAESPTASPPESDDSSAAVPAGHRLVSEQVLAGAMARERAMGRQQGMAEGRAAASVSAEQEILQLRAVLQGLQSSLTDTRRLFEPMQRLALHLAEQLVRGELEFSSRAIRRLIESALLEVDQKLAFSVRLNPEDLQLLRTSLGEDDAMHMAGDPGLSRGSVRVEMDDGVVEDLIENRLDTLARSLLGPEVKPHASVLSRASLHHAPSATTSVAAPGSLHAAQPAAHAMPAMPSHNAVVEPGLARQDWTPPFARHEVSDIEPVAGVAAVEPVHGYPHDD